MPRSVIGVDIGSHAIKVVELRGRWRGFDVVKAVVRHLPVENGQPCPPEHVSQALTELLSAHAIRPTQVVSAIPAQATFVRNLLLPFRDPRKIREVLKFELEPHIPSPVEDVIVDFAKIRDTEAGGCEVLAVAVPKTVVAEHLQVLALAGLSPDLVDWEICGGLNGYLTWRHFPIPVPVALVNLGASKTTITVVQGGRLQFARSVMRGGQALTEGIRQRMTLTVAQAEALKLSERDKERVQIAEPIDAFLTQLTKDIDHTLLAYSAHAGSDTAMQEFILLGGGAALPEALTLFSEHYGVGAVPFDVDQRVFAPLVMGGQASVGLVMPVALGLATRLVNRQAQGLNFRQEEFAVHRSYDEIRGQLLSLGGVVALLVGLALFNLYYHLHNKEIQYAQLQEQVGAIFRDTFPDVRRVSNEVGQARDRLREIETNLRGVSSLSGPQGSALELLREVSVRLPQGLQVKITDLTISTEGIGVSGETQSFDGVDNLKTAFAASPYFDDIKVSQARAGTNGKGVEFKLAITLKKS